MTITKKLTKDKCLNAIYRSAAEYEKLLGKDFLIIGKNRKSDYFWFECFFEKKNFMHLLGIKSRTMSADEFFDRCISYNKGEGKGLVLDDCSPSRNHNRTTINEKSSCCADILRIKDAKYMNIARKDKISQYVDFSYAYGSEATLGFKESVSNRCFPISLIPRRIDEFATQKYRINFVFDKVQRNEQYENLLMEIKEGVFAQHYEMFPEKLKVRVKIDKFVRH